jgi:hypothetical protein
MKVLRLAAAILFCWALSAVAHAQVINRANVPAGYATPTDGTFSIRFPIPFMDMAERGDSFGADAETVVHMVTGMTGSGIRLSAAEMPDPNNKLAPVDTFMDKLKQRLGARAVLSDVSRDQNGNTNAVSFALAAHGRGFYFRVIRADRSQYILLVQFPESQRDTATELKEAFFSSFSFARP